ncbi:unnamed protein product [Fraxinus pennsylvanica]|uniref:Alcohol dehydrogenase-like C-terminal domain-containing protein n=1 Tax=Fraxinus pennsylvanica TaxID=56036 RepID=A0AAD1ZU80_9LAMI|nr:unnamed protein product [Fraxinus pennsylvanica]
MGPNGNSIATLDHHHDHYHRIFIDDEPENDASLSTTDCGYSRAFVFLDIIWNLTFVLVSFYVLMTTNQERPSTPSSEAIGITDFINPKDMEKPVHQKIRELTNGGVHYSFECAGNLDVLREAFLSTHDGWGLTVVSGIHPTPRMLPLHPMELFDGRRIVGSVFGDFKGKSQLPHFANQCMNGEVKLDEFITHEMPFANINQALQLLIDGKSLRCLLHL